MNKRLCKTRHSALRLLILVLVATSPYGPAMASWGPVNLYVTVDGTKYTYSVQGSFPTKQAALAALQSVQTENVFNPPLNQGYGSPAALKETGLSSMSAANNQATYSFAPPAATASPTWVDFSWVGAQLLGGIDSYSDEGSADAALNFGSCDVQSGLGQSAVVPAGPWVIGGFNGSTETRAYAQTVTTVQNGECVSTTTAIKLQALLYNGATCPPINYTVIFDPSSQQYNCVNSFAGSISGPIMDCPANGSPTPAVGDPCDVATGDFSQTEPDYFGAGLQFTRYYHALTQETTHNLGVGWTDNFAAYLILSNGEPVGLLRPDGHHDAVQDINGEYISVSGAGIHVQQGNSNTWVAYRHDGSSEVYSATGQLLQVISAAGLATTLTYNSTTGLLSSVSDPFGHSLQFTYNANQQLQTMTEPDGTSAISYAYDGNNNLVSATFPDGSVRQYQYQNSSFPNNLTGIVDESGVQFLTINYDPTTALVVSAQQAGGAQAVSISYGAGTGVVTNGLGAVSTYTFGGSPPRVTSLATNTLLQSYSLPPYSVDPQQRVTQSTDSNGNVTTYSYDADHMTSRTEAYGTPLARTTSYQYLTQNNSLPLLVTEALKQTTFAYYSATNLVQTRTVTDPATGASRSWNYTYDSYGRVLTALGPRTDVNSTTTYTYYTCSAGAQCGELQTETDAAGNVTTYNTYNAHGQPLTITDPNGVVTTLTYDSRQRLLSRSAAGETTSFSYYPTGLVQTVTLADGGSLKYTYDGAHRLIGIKDALGNVTQYMLDSMGNQLATSTFDPSDVLATTLSRVYNTLNELYQVVGSAGTMAVTTTFTYDNNGNETGISAPLGRNTASGYDSLNRLVLKTDANGGNTQVGYDANNNLVTLQDPTGLATTYQYDGLGDVLSVLSPQTGLTANTYDSAGNLAISVDARGVRAAYSYDALNRVTQMAYGDETIAFGYDAGGYGKGRLTSASDAAQSLNWQYDALGRVVQKVEMVGNVTAMVGYAYANGDMVTLTTPSGQSIIYTYSNHQISSISINGTPLLSGVSYQPFGPTRGFVWGNGAAEVRTYDNDGNPSQFSGAEATAYTVDSAFRVTGIANTSTPSVSWTYGYDPLDRLTSASGPSTLSWTYDADGNRYSQSGSTPVDSTVTLSYNNRGRLVNAATTIGSMTAVYSALGQRVQKASWLGTVEFVYDEAGHLLGEYDGNGDLVEETVWLDDLPVATLQPNGNGGVNVFYIHADHLGTPKTITRPSDNAIVWRWDQDPFGTATPNSNPSGIGTFTYNLRFQGQYYDAETGLNYNFHRDFDPSVGRYVESDPIGLMAGINTYGFAGANPVSNSDSLGLLDNPAEVMNYYPYQPPSYQVVSGIPPGSVWYQTPSGVCFVGPPGVNWQAMYLAGWAASLGAPVLVAQGAPLDLQRSNGIAYPAYQYAANFGVGVVMNGGGYSLWASTTIGNWYGRNKSSNFSNPNNTWAQWWASGWNAANSGQLPTGPSPKCPCNAN